MSTSAVVVAFLLFACASAVRVKDIQGVLINNNFPFHPRLKVQYIRLYLKPLLTVAARKISSRQKLWIFTTAVLVDAKQAV